MTTTATRTKTRKPAKTIGEKKAQAEALHNSISDQVERLRDAARWTAFIDFARRSIHAQPATRAYSDSVTASSAE